MKQDVSYKIVGVASLIMHSGILANPFNSIVKEMKRLSGKRSKTDADLEELARLEWYGGLYVDGGLPCLPGECMEATLLNAAKKRKLGQQVRAGLRCDDNFLLEYDGPKNIDALWANEDFRYFTKVRIGTSTIMRMRPIFHEWATKITVTFNDELLNIQDVNDIVAIGGDIIGLLDRRPKFGRYQVA